MLLDDAMKSCIILSLVIEKQGGVSDSYLVPPTTARTQLQKGVVVPNLMAQYQQTRTIEE